MRESSAYQGAYAAILRGYSITLEQMALNHVYVIEEEQHVLAFVNTKKF